MKIRGNVPVWLILLATSTPALLGATLYALDVGQQMACLACEATSVHLTEAVLDALIETRAGRPREALTLLDRASKSPGAVARSQTVSYAFSVARDALVDGDRERRLSTLVDCVKAIAEAGGLVLDTDAASYAVMDSCILKLPELVALDGARQGLIPGAERAIGPSSEAFARFQANDELIRLSIEGIQRDVREGFRLAPVITASLPGPALELEKALLDEERVRGSVSGAGTMAQEPDRIDLALHAFRKAATGTFLHLIDHRIQLLWGGAFRTLSGLLALLVGALVVTALAIRRFRAASGPSREPSTPDVIPTYWPESLVGTIAPGTLLERGIPVTPALSRWNPDTDQEAV